jgi:hypothetical protein
MPDADGIPSEGEWLEGLRPDQEPRTGGVAVTRRYAKAFPGIEGYAYRETRQPSCADGLTMIVGDEYGIWFPFAEAEALIDRDTRDNEWAEAITAVFPWEIDGDEDVMGCVVNHVSNLASLYEEMIDPNDPAVRERLAKAFWDCAIGTKTTTEESVNAILAALRGAK